MRTRADVVRDEVPVVCHGDFHPLNVLSRPLGSRWEHVVIDWTDSVAGDRHYDVARTVAIFHLASIAAGSGAERLALKAAGPWLARTYRRAYERELAIDPQRFAYWTAAHLLRGWAQIVGLHQGLYAEGPGDADAVPLAVAEALLVWADGRARLDRLSQLAARSPRMRARLRHFQMQSTWSRPAASSHCSWLKRSRSLSDGSSRAPISSRHRTWSSGVGLATISRFAKTPPGARSAAHSA